MILSIKASISSSLASSRSWSASSNPQFCEGAWRLMRSYPRRERRKTHASEFQSKRNVHNLVMCNAKELHSQRIASSKRHRWLDQPRTASHPNFKPTRTSPVP